MCPGEDGVLALYFWLRTFSGCGDVQVAAWQSCHCHPGRIAAANDLLLFFGLYFKVM